MSRQGVCLVASLSAVVGMGAQPPAEGSLGRMPVPPIVGMNGPETGCSGFVLAVGSVDAAEHEAQDGYFSVGGVSLSVRPESAAAMRLRSEQGKPMELVLRPVASRELGKVER